MNSYTILGFNKQMLEKSVTKGDLVVDATLGNGNDALLLAELVGADGHVFGFDKQEQAVAASKVKLAAYSERCTLFCAGHEQMQALLPEAAHGQIKAIVFNLGYLPGGDETITTLPETTLQALDAALAMLAPEGFVLLTAYPGHATGSVETDAVAKFLQELDFSEYMVFTYQLLNNKNHPPQTYIIEKRKKRVTE